MTGAALSQDTSLESQSIQRAPLPKAPQCKEHLRGSTHYIVVLASWRWSTTGPTGALPALREVTRVPGVDLA
jgi:hypothetical protein